MMFQNIGKAYSTFLNICPVRAKDKTFNCFL